MWTIIVGDGLTREFLSSDIEYLSSPLNVGQHEIERLLGRGRDFGNGPLPAFLRTALHARNEGSNVRCVFLQRQATAPSSDASGEVLVDAASFVEPLNEVAAEAEIVPATPLGVPWTEFGGAVERLTGTDPLRRAAERDDIQFLVVGCHAEHRILAIASFLRNVLGFTRVAVCSHLTGSATREAYYAALRHNFPAADISVFVDLADAIAFAGLTSMAGEELSGRPCTIDPPEVRTNLTEEQHSIVEFLCMHWTRAQLRPLQGGYSGSALFLAEGWKGAAHTEPMVLKIDQFAQMRREIDGYHQVKDFFGKHVPTFDYPVALGASVGVAMEFAAMDGSPETLQDTFESAREEEKIRHFTRRLDKALQLLVEKLYRNTSTVSWVTPYRAFGLHTEQQLRYLDRNLEHILRYCADESAEIEGIVDPKRLRKILKLVTSNEDGVESEICLAHGDLNFQNIICDEADNIWFIDWTHSGYYPLELDFAKLESDVKFVMTKEFDIEDLPRLKKFEEYLLAHCIPAGGAELPDSLKFAKWDLRFRKILDAVRRIREACFSAKDGEDWLVYRIALLRYAMHTLSFDKRRDRGECDFPQLMHALYSVEGLAFNLVADDFHLRIRGERPSSYPARQRISIDESLWDFDCPDYSPPYHVDATVVQSDRTSVSAGWADPEDFQKFREEGEQADVRHRDDEGRPLNPRGRTGIAGRGLLGRWGANPAVAAIVTRDNAAGDRLDVLLGRPTGGTELRLPKGFVRPEESPRSAVARIVENETGWSLNAAQAESVFEGYVYDPRQTDHAWVEVAAFLFHHQFKDAVSSFKPHDEFEDVRWYPLDPDTVNKIPPGQARFVREAVKKLQDAARISQTQAASLLAMTG